MTKIQDAHAQFERALKGVLERIRIIEQAADQSLECLLQIFSVKESLRSASICQELIQAVADLPALKFSAYEQQLIKDLQAASFDINSRLSLFTPTNPLLAQTFMSSEATFLDLLERRDPTVHYICQLSAKHSLIVRSALVAGFGQLRSALKELHANRNHTPLSREDAIAFMRSIYTKSNDLLSSTTKVVSFVRNCKDEADPFFKTCSQIQLCVQLWAKKERDGVEKVWRSLAQEIKPSSGRVKKSERMSPIPIPDRSWV